MIRTLRTIPELRQWRASLGAKTLSFVPTMGSLHEGHEALMRRALEHSEALLVSVYVNPAQFGPGEDLSSYPRDLAGDLARSEAQGAEALFVPSDAIMYPEGFSTRVIVDRMGDRLCGAHRPGHFDGVTLVLAKLFNLTRPDLAVFGRKDYQQLAIVRRMVRDLNFPVEILGVETVREPDGLAKSSRNRYLDEPQRAAATILSRALVHAWMQWRDGEHDARAILSRAHAQFASEPLARVDYIELVDPETLLPLNGLIDPAHGAVMALAVQLGRARLIDNTRLDEPLPGALAQAR